MTPPPQKKKQTKKQTLLKTLLVCDLGLVITNQATALGQNLPVSVSGLLKTWLIAIVLWLILMSFLLEWFSIT